MRELIEEINTKLKDIINDLIKKRIEVSESLNVVQEKIDDKIEEAKGYKNNVDAAKDSIRLFESEIESLKSDLQELNTRFSNKDLNAIIDAGNREINGKIAVREKEIAKQREKISELTERARTIKDLLINLKKDKESKKSRLDNLNDVIYYYEQEINKMHKAHWRIELILGIPVGIFCSFSTVIGIREHVGTPNSHLTI